MKSITYTIGIRTLIVVGMAAAFSLTGAGKASAQAITTCDSGTDLSFNQVIDGIAAGEIIIDRAPDISANMVTVTVTNNTPCGFPASLSNHRMYIDYSLATLSQQEFYSGTPTRTVAASTTEVFTTNIADCLSQYDLWYGDYLVVIPDFLTWGNLLTGDQVRLGEYCTPPVVVPVVPIVATLDADTVCAVPGQPILFTASASGDSILSRTLESDAAASGVYSQVVSGGIGAGTDTFTTSEAASYSGVYSVKYLVNGVEMARKDVVVAGSCAPVVVAPAVIVPVVEETVVTTSSSGSSGSSHSPRTIVPELAVVEPVAPIAPVTYVADFVPGLPDTGFGPNEKSVALNLASLLGLILLPLFLRSNRKIQA